MEEENFDLPSGWKDDPRCGQGAGSKGGAAPRDRKRGQSRLKDRDSQQISVLHALTGLPSEAQQGNHRLPFPRPRHVVAPPAQPERHGPAEYGIDKGLPQDSSRVRLLFSLGP